MRIVFITSVYEFGIKSLESLLAQGEQIVAVIMPPVDPGDQRGMAIKQLGADHAIPVYEWKSVNKPERVEIIRALQADLAVSAGNMRFIFKRPFLDSFTHGAINYHCSLLPEDGGMYPVHWQIYKGLDYIGITIHQCDDTIDTGDLILQKKVPIGPDEGFKSVYFGGVLEESVNLLSEAVRQIREGTVVRTPQDSTKATYNPPFGEEQFTIRWTDPAQQIYNTIRACDAWPGAQTTLRGEIFKVWAAKLLPDHGADASPGTILDLSGDSIIVAATAGRLRLERVQLGDGPKLMVADFLQTCDLVPGEVLGT